MKSRGVLATFKFHRLNSTHARQSSRVYDMF